METPYYVNHLITYGYLDGRLKDDEHAIKRALKLYQSFFRDDLTTIQAESGYTSCNTNGVLDEATITHMEQPRCGCADFLEGETLGGSGSWPMGCHGSGKFHRVRIYFDQEGMPTHWKPVFDEAWLLVQASYRDMGIDLERVALKSKANITVSWERSRSWIGLAIVGRNLTCSKVIWAKFDNQYGKSFTREQLINQLAMLLAHEFGHNMGLSHSNGGVMNPTLSRFKFTTTSWRRDPQEPTMRRWFGGVPFNVNPTPTPIPDPTPPPPQEPPTELSLGMGWVNTSDGSILIGFGTKPTTLTVGNKTYTGVSL